MDGKDAEAEIHPLKNEEGREQKPPAGPGKEAPKSPHTRLSRCRAVAFFLSLFLCLLVVFVVSFIIPCPERPLSQKTWSVNVTSAAALDFLATEDINSDKIQDVFFLYSSTYDSGDLSNHSCADQGFASPCSVMAAVSGANGSVLWARPVAQQVRLADCISLVPKGCSTCILLRPSGSLDAINSCTGENLWTQPIVHGDAASILSPFLPVPDTDADQVLDLLVLSQEGEVHCSIISGRTGLQIGNKLNLGVRGAGSPLLYITSLGAHYLLLPCRTSSSLCSWSLKQLYKQMTDRDTAFMRDVFEEDMLNATVHRLLQHSSGGVRQVVRITGSKTQELLLMAADGLALLRDQQQEPLWILGATHIMRTPVLGYFKPQAKTLAVENGTSNLDRQILLLDVNSGTVLWRQALPSLPGAPESASLLTSDSRSAFFFWGLPPPANNNQTAQGPQNTTHSLYMFHPTLPDFLLELINVSARVMAFRAVLLEPSRNGALLLLTGPAGPSAYGPVSLVKYRVRDLIRNSRVVSLQEHKQDQDLAIRDRFSRLRYQST